MTEARYICDFEGCTFADTNVCARTGDGKPCEHAHLLDPEANGETEPTKTQESPLDLDPGTDSNEASSAPASREVEAEETGSPVTENDGKSLYSGEELDAQAASSLMTERPSRLIAILGEEKAGKTCLLTCFYLMALSGELNDFGLLFAGSRTLPGFESRSRPGRDWPEDLPESLSIRTTTQGRSAGFLHLDLVEQDSMQWHRLLLSDIPGEWTDAAIDSFGNMDRLSFVLRADAILLLVDGNKLRGRSMHGEAERHRVFIDRLKSAGVSKDIPIWFVATREDELVNELLPGLDQLAEIARENGFSADSVRIATYSQSSEVRSAHGVGDLLLRLLESTALETKSVVSSNAVRLFGYGPVMQGRAEL